MSKRDLPFGNIPCQILLVGPTASDPRALEAAQRSAAAIYRFQAISRDRAIQGQLNQQGALTTLPNGIQLRYVFNQGLETLRVYVPLPASPVTVEQRPVTKADTMLVIDMLFSCTPLMRYEKYFTGPHWDTCEIVLDHSSLWGSGVVLSQQGSPDIDVTSVTPFGASAGAPKAILSSAEVLPQDVTDSTSVTQLLLAHDPAELNFPLGANAAEFSGAQSAAKVYESHVGSSYLLRPKTTKPLVLKIKFAHGNVYSDPESSDPFSYFQSLAPIVIQAREYQTTEKLMRVPFQTIEQRYTFEGVSAVSDTGSLTSFSTSTTNVTQSSWHMLAGTNFVYGGGAPADTNQKGMGNLLYTSEQEASYKYLLNAIGDAINITSLPGFEFTAYNMSQNYDYTHGGTSIVIGGTTYYSEQIAGPPADQYYDTLIYPGSAASMSLLATLTYTPGAGGGRGSATVDYNNG